MKKKASISINPKDRPARKETALERYCWEKHEQGMTPAEIAVTLPGQGFKELSRQRIGQILGIYA